MSNSRIIIADVHGCHKTLMALITQLPKDVPITFAGDLIDRGQNSRKVIEFVKNGGYDCVLGNHELMMINDLQFRKLASGREVASIDSWGVWDMNGGRKCLDSYVEEYGEVNVEVLKEHVAWLKALPYHIEYPDLTDKNGRHLLVTHSTASEVWGEYSPENPIFQNAVTWDRINEPKNIPGIFNVYGHTPQSEGATVEPHFACIDTGAYYKKKGYGVMTAYQFPEGHIYTQENLE